MQNDENTPGRIGWFRRGGMPVSSSIAYTTYNWGIPVGNIFGYIIGSFLIGIIYGLAEEHKIMTQEFRLFLAIGFCGSFTTFSTFAAENLNLFQLNTYGPLTANIILSVVFGIAAVFGGIALTRILVM